MLNWEVRTKQNYNEKTRLIFIPTYLLTQELYEFLKVGFIFGDMVDILE